jgi:hypothetical protein
MSMKETVEAYEMLSRCIFSRKGVLSRIHRNGRFDSELFASIIQAVIKEKTDDIHAKLVDDRPDACKMYVSYLLS